MSKFFLILICFLVLASCAATVGDHGFRCDWLERESAALPLEVAAHRREVCEDV